MELFYPSNWQSTTIEQFIEAVDTYIRWYNEKRINASLGRLSPVEYWHKLVPSRIKPVQVFSPPRWVNFEWKSTPSPSPLKCYRGTKHSN